MNDLAYNRAPVRYFPPAGLSVLFSPLPKGGRRPALDLSVPLGPEQFLHFSAREALGVQEQTLLLAILEMAGEQYAFQGEEAVVTSDDPRAMLGRLWTELHPDGGSDMPQTLMVRYTWEELNRRCGTKNGGSIIDMRKVGLRRLCEVIVWEEHRGRRKTRQSFLLVWVEGDDRHIHLALNHRLASVFFGGQYAKVWMVERLRLGNDVAMLIHAFLSSCMRPGNSLTIGLETLAARVWPGNHETAPAGTQRRRRTQLRSALNAINRLPHWAVTWETVSKKPTKAVIRRAEGLSVRDMTLTQSAGYSHPLGISPHVQSSSVDNVWSLFVQ